MKQACLLFVFLYSTQVWAVQNISFGAKVDKHAGVTVLVSDSQDRAFHITASLQPSEFAAVDIEQIHYLLSMMSTKLLDTSFYFKPYYAVGIRSEADRELAAHEAIYAKTSLGGEFQSYSSPVQLFVDVSPILGPLPRWRFGAYGRLGFRTRF